MNTKVNGMSRKDFYLDILKKNAYLCDVIMEKLQKDMKKGTISKEWQVKAKWNMSLRSISGYRSFDESVSHMGITICIMNPSMEPCVEYTTTGNILIKKYGITYSKLHKILTTYPTTLKLRNRDLDVVTLLYAAHKL